jgi:hypothetical protein
LYPHVNSPEVIEKLTDKKFIYPNMTAGNWEDDYTDYIANQNNPYYDDEDDEDDDY